MEHAITLDDVLTFFSKVPGFNTLSQEDLTKRIIPIVGVVRFAPGQNIIKKNTFGTSLYFLYRGEARVEVVVDDKHQTFSIKEGGMVGEISLVSHEKTIADVFALTQTTCLTIDVETFQSVIADYWPVTKAVSKLIGVRLLHLHSLSHHDTESVEHTEKY